MMYLNKKGYKLHSKLFGKNRFCMCRTYSISDVLIKVLGSSGNKMSEKRVENDRIEQYFRIVKPIFQIQFAAVVGIGII